MSTLEGSGAVSLENVRKTYDDGRVVACEDINIDIGGDELVVLLGPSGCGKTTTLRSIAGLEEVDSGRIVIDGQDVTNLPPKERDVAFVFQSVTLFPHKTVRENMTFGLDMKTDLSRAEKDERVEEAAQLLGIEELLERKPSALSGGEQQRVSLGRAMVMKPNAFLLDEPFSALDANLRDQLQTEIQRLHAEVETSMVFVTHDQEEAMTIGDRIVVMRDGTIQQIGTPYEIYNDPSNLFVAKFIGSPSTNIVECTVDGSVLKTDAFSYTVSDDIGEALRDAGADTVFLGIRPSKVTVDGSHDVFSASVDVVEPLGDDDAVYFSKNGTEFCAKTDPGAVSEGMDISVGFDEENVWLFDSDGARIV